MTLILKENHQMDDGVYSGQRTLSSPAQVLGLEVPFELPVPVSFSGDTKAELIRCKCTPQIFLNA